MATLPEGWKDGYDGTRWFYRYKETDIIQYHFPRPGDEFAEFMFDTGTGPLELTPEESLAIEQQHRQNNNAEGSNDGNGGAKSSGSKRQKKKIAAIEEEDGMNATGYFDPSSFMYFPGAYTDVSPLDEEEDDDGAAGASNKKMKENTSSTSPGASLNQIHSPSEGETVTHQSPGSVNRVLNVSTSHPVAAELPEGEAQMWSPVGFIAELATQETVKCAEELAPIELDATPSMPVQLQTNVPQQPAELPTHRTPVDEKAPEPKPSQPITQPVESYPLVSASFSFPPLKADPATQSQNGSSGTNPEVGNSISQSGKETEAEQNKFQPWKPTQGTLEQQSQAQSNASIALPQTSVLQTQNTELGEIDQKHNGNIGAPRPGVVPNPLAPPSDPRTSASVNYPPPNPGGPSIPAAPQPAQPPSNQLPIPGTGARHESISAAGTHSLSHAPSILKPGGRRPIADTPENLGGQKINSNSQAITQHPSQQAVQASSINDGRPSVTRVNTLPDRLPGNPASPPKVNGSPGFLFFHEIPPASNLLNQQAQPTTSSHNPNAGQVNPPAQFIVHETAPVVAPLSLVKRHSSKSSAVSSISPEGQDSGLPSHRPTESVNDDISEVISVISTMTPQATPGPGQGPSVPPSNATPADSTKPGSHTSTSTNGPTSERPDVVASSRPPFSNNQQPTSSMQQAGGASKISPQVPLATTNKPQRPVPDAISFGQINANTPSPGATQNVSNTQAVTNMPLNVLGAPFQSPPPPKPSFEAGSSTTSPPGKVSVPPGPVKPQSNVASQAQTLPPATAARPPSMISHNAGVGQAQHPIAQNALNYNANNLAQRPPHVQQATTVPSNGNSLSSAPTTSSTTSQVSPQPTVVSNALAQSAARPQSFGYPQTSAPRPNLQQPATPGPSNQQPISRPPVAHQALGLVQAQGQPQPSHHSSPATQPVSPLQSQVSSPAQSIASLHMPQASTPSHGVFTTNGMSSPGTGSAISPNQGAPTPAHLQIHQTSNGKPVGSHGSPLQSAGNTQHQSSSQSQPPSKPYPMLPGQVTPLPSQIGSPPAPVPGPPQVQNNPSKPATAPAGQQMMQTTPATTVQHHPPQAQNSASPYSAQATGSLSFQAQTQQPQQPAPSAYPNPNQVGFNQATAHHSPHHSPHHSQTQHMPSYAPHLAQSQVHTHTPQQHTIGTPPTSGQSMFPPPPPNQTQQTVQSSGVTSPASPTPGKPSSPASFSAASFSSTPAGAALTDAGKGMKKWAKKMLKSPGIKQTTMAIGGAVMAESFGGNAVAGAQIASSIYANAHRPQLNHAQTAPPQPHVTPGAHPQQHTVQAGQQFQPGRPPSMQVQPHPQPNPQPVHMQQGQPQQLQPGRPPLGHIQQGPVQPGHQHQAHPQQGHPQQGHPQQGHPQQGHPQQGHPQQGHPQQGHPQQGHPQQGHPQPGHPQPGNPQPGHPQPGHPQPGHPQPGHPQPGYPQPVRPQPIHHPVIHGQPPAPYNPALAAGVSANFNGQIHAQAGINQQQQYPMAMARPPMVMNQLPPPPPAAASVQAYGSIQGQAQVNINVNPNTAALIGSAVGAAMRPDHPQSQQQQGHHGQAAAEHDSRASQGYTAENNNYDMTYNTDNTSHYTANNTDTTTNNSYVENNNVVVNNNTTYVENSTVVVADSTTYVDNTDMNMNMNYVDMSDNTYVDTTTTTGYDGSADINASYYAADTSMTTFSMEESVAVDSSSMDFGAVTSVDYSGDSWGSVEF